MQRKDSAGQYSSATDALRSGNRVVTWGIGAVVAILLLAAVLLFLSLPDANAFNARVERTLCGKRRTDQ